MSFLSDCVLTICSWCVMFSDLRVNTCISPADVQSDLLLTLQWVTEETFKLPVKSGDYLEENRNFIHHWRAGLQKHPFHFLHWTALGNGTRAPELGNSWLSHRMKFLSSALFLYGFKQATKCQLLSPSPWNVLINPFSGNRPALSPTCLGSVSLTCEEISHFVPWAVRGTCSARRGLPPSRFMGRLGSVTLFVFVKKLAYLPPDFLLAHVPLFIWLLSVLMGFKLLWISEIIVMRNNWIRRTS